MTSSTLSDIEMAHEPRDIDVSAAGRGVWLVKVPKYLSEQWKSCASGTDVGKLKISKTKLAGKKPDIVFSTFNLARHLSTAHPTSQKAQSTPGPSGNISAHRPPSAAGLNVRNHKFLMTNVVNQNLVVMSRTKTDVGNKDSLHEKISVEGKVLQRAECHPIVDANYRLFKKEQVQAQNTPVRQMKLLSDIVQTYKPVSDHFNNLEDKRTKKTETKRSRAEKEQVMDILFNAFEKHQFYNFKDLVGITKQPAPYLKEILREFCIYNMTAPHKNMWELKPEFRHYKQHEGAAQ